MAPRKWPFGRAISYRNETKTKTHAQLPPDPITPKSAKPPGVNSDPAKSQAGNSKTNNYNARDRWQMAGDALGESDQVTLPQDAGRARTGEILDQIVKATDTQYKEDPRYNGTRATAHKILNCVLSFQNVVDNAMTKNHADLRDALLDSSEYLADLLARCTFIEAQFYREVEAAITNIEKEKSMIRVYQLAQLKTSTKGEESHLHHGLLLNQHHHQKAEAEAILTQIDNLVMKIEKVERAVDMLNLPFADGAFFDSSKDQHKDECLPGTREALLQQVKDWGRPSDKAWDRQVYYCEDGSSTV
ncbi:uncharacterized protein BO97DRAFT_473364 [Aspergillus homomorphus CBS 101889]|uniref:Uncharacterized protein n=1 Tax=Aspergillus homomorphus (strain CBS 101889) TaxID=1450537 RepID=A0A395HKW5_ASPHC|nr:hypothetical protein BO97DRAFT_473364 [Aspergillus homomorphus CBS 101889]RAL07855.1 hypothetical protein BO97DRAFT_473364 [Aspergillus homomorphus CBS 101889]